MEFCGISISRLSLWEAAAETSMVAAAVRSLGRGGDDNVGVRRLSRRGAVSKAPI